MGKRYVLGDVHGNARALKQVLERSPIDLGSDTLYCVGDYVDGWPDSYEVVETLCQLPGVEACLGNHDQWALEWMRTGRAEHIWTSQGGRATLDSYEKHGLPRRHINFLVQTENAILTEDNRLFVHAGINPAIPLESNRERDLLWSRDLFNLALAAYYREQNEEEVEDLTEFGEVYIGHTSTNHEFKAEDGPIRGAEVWMVDQGAGFDGRLTIMDIDSKEYWQSDPANELYPSHGGRMG